MNKIKIKHDENDESNKREPHSLSIIEDNLDSLILNKMNLLLKQKKEEEKTKHSKIRVNSTEKNVKNLIYKNPEIIKKRITLGQFIIESSQQKEMPNMISNYNKNDGNINANMNLRNTLKPLKTNKSQNVLNNIRRKSLLGTNDYLSMKKFKEESKNYKKQQMEREKHIEALRKDIEKIGYFKLSLNKDARFVLKRRIGKRYTLFKTILNYLESNNITLDELLHNNPFQIKPYELEKSYDFLLAIKFQNYQYVLEALQFTNRYLFSFDYYGQTAYHWAAKLADLKMLKILLSYGMYHNQKDFKGRTPLYIAALNNHKDVCVFLLNNNGNIFLKDKKGLCPADVAGSLELKAYLFDFMTLPFSNPIYKARIQSLIKEREERIKKKRKDSEKSEKKIQEEKGSKSSGLIK